LAASIDDRVPGAHEFGADLFGPLVIGGTGPNPRGAENRHRGPEFGEQPEALDELRLDP
jgi:hypothetical protein